MALSPKTTQKLLLGAAAAILLISASVFTVDVTKQAIVLRFGEPVTIHSDAGLKFKLPWPIETVAYFERRNLDVSPPAERVNISSDERMPLIEGETRQGQTGSIPIIVDTFARYRIVDPLLFLQRMGNETLARPRIEGVMNAATRDVLARTTLTRLLSSERATLMNQIRDRVNAEMKDRGIEIVDIRIGRADLTEQLRDSTVGRMITERRQEATEARAEGQEKAQEIRALADKERTIILAEATRKSEALRGAGDNEAISIITKAANEDKDFYAFMRTMFAYQNTLAHPDTTLILSPDSTFLKYLKSNKAN